MNNTVVVSMSACRHVGMYSPPPFIADTLINLFERVGDSCFWKVLISPQIYFEIFNGNIGYCRHVSMLACKHGLTPL